jgi:hypothetical protein
MQSGGGAVPVRILAEATVLAGKLAEGGGVGLHNGGAAAMESRS